MTRGCPVDAVGIIATAYQEGTKDNSEVETISSLPLEDVGRGRNNLWEFIWNQQLFIFQKVSDKLRALLPFIEFSVGQLRGSNGGANELPLSALVPRSQKKFAHWIVDDFKLAFIFKDMLENQFFFGSILKVASGRFPFL